MPPNSEPQSGHDAGTNGHSTGDVEPGIAASTRSQMTWATRIKANLQDEMNLEDVGAALLCQCIIAGAADAAAYSQTNTWSAFMTGNLTQLIMAFMTILMTTPAPQASILRLASSASAVSGFITGSFIAMLVDKRYGGRTRGKLVAWALWRASVFLALAPCIALFGWNGPSGMVFLYVMAANMGSMAVNATKLGATPYATTVVFTASLASLFSDPLLPFGISGPSRKRGFSILGLLIGGAAAQATMIGISRATRNATLAMLEEMTYFTWSAPQPMPIGSAFAVGGAGLFEVVAAICWYKARRAQS